MLDRDNLRLIYAATLALVIGLTIYLSDRQADVYFLQGLPVITDPRPLLFGVVGHNLPSFVHIYAFILLTVVCLPPRRLVVFATCAAWFLVECFFEIGQHPLLQLHLVKLVPEWFDGIPLLEASAGYFRAGSFDYLDVLAAALGATAAWLTIFITRHTNHESE